MNKNVKKNVLLLGMLCSFIGVTLFSMMYMAKDNNYDNTIFQYFNISKSLYSRLIMINVDKELLVNGMNISSLLFIACNFSLSQPDRMDKSGWYPLLRTVLFAFLGLQLVVYSPFFYRFVYEGGLLFLPDPVIFRKAYALFHQITVAGNFAALLLSSGYMVKEALRKEPIKELRYTKWSLTVIHMGIGILYFYMYFSLPYSFLWVSRAINYTSFQSLVMAPYIPFMRVIPYLAVLFILVFWFNSYKYEQAAKKLRDEDYQFSTIAASSEISTRAFSHYIKNELLGIVAETEWMMQEHGALEAGLESIRSSCMNMYERLDILQKNSNRIVLNQSLKDILGVLEDTLKEMQELLKSNHVSVVFLHKEQNAWVFCDLHYLSEVFRNLIFNAVDAMGETNVREIKISMERYDRQIKLEFADSGPGINPAILEKVFEPFVSTKSTKYNWGIGLSFAKRIIQSHNGKIEAASPPGQGAVFTIYLPIVEWRSG